MGGGIQWGCAEVTLNMCGYMLFRRRICTCAFITTGMYVYVHLYIVFGMCVHVCICVYMCVYVCTHTCVFGTWVYVHTCICTWSYVHTCICIHVYLVHAYRWIQPVVLSAYLQIDVCICTCVSGTWVYVHTCICIHVYLVHAYRYN